MFFCFTSKSQEVTVFRSGDDGYASYRIPAIVKLKNGNLIAFSEGRVNDAGDFGDVDIVYKISTDLGKNWGKLHVAVNYNAFQAGNPAPVEDLLDKRYPNGRLFLFYNTGNNHESEVRKGNGFREVWYIASTDGGLTWSQPVNITTEVHRPYQPQINPNYHFTEDWRAYANTPGHAIQINSGKYKGRIFIAANHSVGNLKNDFSDYYANGFYTDDHSKTFHISESLKIAGSNESQAAQVGNNEIYMNSRNQRGNFRSRIVAYSSDGGETWDTAYYDNNLTDPVNQGSVISWKEGGKYILAFSNSNNDTRRDNLTLRISKDKGKSWHSNEVVLKSPSGNENNFTGYSDLVYLKKDRIGILFEKDNYQQIVFKEIKIK